ncbi:MAG: hypothetical protein KGR26_14575, partial [Cyanobacteria bacterium REEB65]|nr:hypothetical protein [Cyanobacteria bacterium REEB65]
VVIANITTLREDSPDQTCIVNPGDHPWVQRPSLVFYQGSRLLAVANMTGWFNRNVYRREPDASDGLMARIRRGALDSEATPEEVRYAVMRCLWTPGTPRLV